MITAAFQNSNNKVYFFGDRVEGGEYVRYDAEQHCADPDYPREPLSRWWEGLPFNVVDAALYLYRHPTNLIFFLSRNQYISWPIPDIEYGREEPQTLENFGLHSLDDPWWGVDAAFLNKADTLYMFNGLNYIRRHRAPGALFPVDDGHDIDSGYPKTISEGWGLDWPRVNAAFQNPASGTIYLFNEHEYVRYSGGRQTNQGPDDEYPKSIEWGWGPVVASL